MSRRASGGPPRLGRALIRLRAPAHRRAELDGDVVESWRARRAAGRPHRMPFWRDVWSIAGPTFSAGDRIPIRHGASGMTEDFRFAMRLLRRQPAFAVLIVATLALGIAASTTVFEICDRVLFKPLPYPEPERIVALPPVGFSFAGGRMGVSKSIQAMPVFDGVGMYAAGGLNLGNDPQPARVRAAAVTDGFFRVMGTTPLLGRTIDAADTRDAAAVAVLSHGAWRAYFHSAPDIVGRPIRINSRTFIVAGVMPRGFAFPQDSEIWIPPGSDDQITGEAFAPSLVARLARGASAADAERALTPRASGGKPIRVTLLQRVLSVAVRPTLLFLGAVAGLLLLTTCANVAGLFLSRVSVRTRELSVRASLGASPWRLARQLLIECGVFTALGTAAGVVLAIWMVRLVSAAAPSFAPDADLLALDGRFLVVAGIVTLLAGALFAVVPAAAAFRGQSLAARGTRTATGRRGWLAGVLLAGQVAAALVLLAATSAALAVVVRLTRVDIGFHNDNAAIFELTVPLARYEGQGVTGFVDRLEARLAAVPGVAHVGTTNRAPGSSTIGIGSPISDADEAPPSSPLPTAEALARSASRLVATPGYFATMGVKVVAGRAFTPADRAGAPRVAIVNVSAARQLWRDPAAAVGRRIRMRLSQKDTSVFEVVGVVDDVRLRGVTTDPGRQVYLPFAQMPPFGLVAVAVDARSGDVASLVPALRSALKEVDAEVPAHEVVLTRDLISRFLASERLTLWLSSGFAGLALSLCAIGLYGALSQVVAQRTREIGIRMALGASRGNVRRSVVWRAVRVALAGVAVGIPVCGVVARSIAHFVPALDPPSTSAIVAAAIVLLAVAGLAAWAPARRASAVDPLLALRND